MPDIQPEIRQRAYDAAQARAADVAPDLLRQVADDVLDAAAPLLADGCAPVRSAIMRTGRTLGRTLYLVTPGDDWRADRVIGMVDTPELAEWITAAVNGAGEPAPEESP